MDNNRIMKIDYEWTDGSNEDFQKFYLKTEEFYSSIVGGLKNRTAFVPYNISESIPYVLIASVSDKAVGCAGLKAYSDSEVEIKRVWVDPEFRGNHISTAMMDAQSRISLRIGPDISTKRLLSPISTAPTKALLMTGGIERVLPALS